MYNTNIINILNILQIKLNPNNKQNKDLYIFSLRGKEIFYLLIIKRNRWRIINPTSSLLINVQFKQSLFLEQ